jgi:PAS domain S-box-containing protein
MTPTTSKKGPKSRSAPAENAVRRPPRGRTKARLEADLRASEERFRALFDGMSEGFALHEIVCDENSEPVDYRFLDANPAFERLTGLKRREIIGRLMTEVLPGDSPTWIKIYGAVALTGKPARFENYSSALDRWYEVHAFRTIPGRFAVLFLDVTKRKRIEGDLRRSEQAYRLLFETMLQGIVYQGEDGKILSMNPAAVRILGKTPDEFLGTTSVDQDPGTVKEDGSPFPGEEHPAMVSLRTGREVRNVVMGVYNPREKARRWIQINAVPLIRPGETKPYQVYTIFDDVTERRRMETDLLRSYEELEDRVEARTSALRMQAELLNLANDAIIVRDLEGTIRFWNKGAEAVYGWTAREVLGRSKTDVLRPHHDLTLEELDGGLLAAGRWEGELEHRTKDNRPILILSRQVLRMGKNGEPAEVLEINRDITERRKYEERLRQWQKMEALGTLAGGIAHDFNNILVPIVINAELAQMEASDGHPGDKHVDLILQAARRGKDLVQQIAAFSRPRGKQQSEVDIAKVGVEALGLLRSSLPKNIEVRTHFEAESPVVIADPAHIHQILVNLGTNAAHAMKDRGGVLDVSLAGMDLGREAASRIPGLQPGPYLRLTVSDTGHGMTPEVVARIFDPFFTTKKQGEGAGLGLSVVHGIVKGLGGAITVSSRVDAGTTFEVYLPRARDAAGAGETKEEKTAGGSERILFVDDEEIVLASVPLMLERLGYRVTACSRGAQALELFRQDPGAWDLVITDQAMPAMTGDGLTREILRVRPDIPVILCTGYSDSIQEAEAKNAGVRAFILKPFSINQIAAKIRSALAAVSGSS